MGRSTRYFLITATLLIGRYAYAQQLYQLPTGVSSHMGSLENPNGLKGQSGKTNSGAKGNAFTSLKVGESKTLLDVHGAGTIQRLWFTINNRSPEMLRALRVRIYWDCSEIPAVDIPFGDFFCTPLGKPIAFQSALFTNPEGRSFNCYIPMPFKKGAKFVLSNEGTKDLAMLYFDIDFIKKTLPEKDALYFHTHWQRVKETPIGQDMELLPKVSGKGRFLGVSAGINVNPVYEGSWWGEGEVKMYIDGDDKYPTINGTGTEDYIGTGWEEGVFSNLYQGCLMADKTNGKYTFYRFHIPDAIYFEKDFKAVIQQIGGWDAAKVKALQNKGVPLKLVSLIGNKGFTGLLEINTATDALTKAADGDWVSFYRTDDYAVTAYYYLDKP
jgi:hypothetical protein